MKYGTDLGYRGYTGHEHLDDFGLINMNARLYDPILGRFMGMDPYVQLPDYTQNFNRYSYVLNNPLKYTDPSGAVIGIDDVLIGMAVGAVIGALSGSISYSVKTAMSGGDGDAGQFLKSIGIGFLSGAAGGAVSPLTGAIGDVFGHTLGNIGTELVRATAHGLVGGGLNAVQGENFWQGFGVSSISSLAGSGMGALGMPSGAIPYAMGGVGALTSWGLGGNPISGFMRGYGIGALNHTGGGLSFDDPIQLDEVTVYGRPTNNYSYANIVEGLAGYPYLLGTAGPNSFDCSGAVIYGIRNSVNPNFPRVNAHTLYESYSVPTDNLSRGSVIFYDYTSNGRIDHVTTVLDSNTMLHPSSGANVLQIQPINYLDRYTRNKMGSIYHRNLDWNKIK